MTTPERFKLLNKHPRESVAETRMECNSLLLWSNVHFLSHETIFSCNSLPYSCTS